MNGSFSGPVTSQVDVNNDGEISLAEETVQSIELAKPTAGN